MGIFASRKWSRNALSGISWIFVFSKAQNKTALNRTTCKLAMEIHRISNNFWILSQLCLFVAMPVLQRVDTLSESGPVFLVQSTTKKNIHLHLGLRMFQPMKIPQPMSGELNWFVWVQTEPDSSNEASAKLANEGLPDFLNFLMSQFRTRKNNLDVSMQDRLPKFGSFYVGKMLGHRPSCVPQAPFRNLGIVLVLWLQLYLETCTKSHLISLL